MSSFAERRGARNSDDSITRRNSFRPRMRSRSRSPKSPTPENIRRQTKREAKGEDTFDRKRCRLIDSDTKKRTTQSPTRRDGRGAGAKVVVAQEHLFQSMLSTDKYDVYAAEGSANIDTDTKTVAATLGEFKKTPDKGGHRARQRLWECGIPETCIRRSKPSIKLSISRRGRNS